MSFTNQRFFKRQPSEYEASLQKQVDALKAELVSYQEAVHEEFGKLKTDIEEVRRQLLGYIKPEAEKEEEAVPVGFQTFTQRRNAAVGSASKSQVQKIADKTRDLLKQEQSNG